MPCDGVLAPRGYFGNDALTSAGGSPGRAASVRGLARSIVIVYQGSPADIGQCPERGAEILERSGDYRKGSLERLDKFSFGVTHSLLEGVQGLKASQRCNDSSPSLYQLEPRSSDWCQNSPFRGGDREILTPQPVESIPLEELFSTSSGREEA